MDTKPFIITVIITNLCFICLHIHKYNAIADLTDTKKQLQIELTNVNQQKSQLQQELDILHDKKIVTQYAQKYLHMRPITQRQERRL